MALTLHPRKRIEFVVEKAIAPALIALIERQGATGYTVIPHVTGKGRHGPRGASDVLSVYAMEMIIVVAGAEVANAIVEAAQPLLADFTAIVTVGDVGVVRGDHF